VEERRSLKKLGRHLLHVASMRRSEKAQVLEKA
jgi:hypothetical protein